MNRKKVFTYYGSERRPPGSQSAGTNLVDQRKKKEKKEGKELAAVETFFHFPRIKREKSSEQNQAAIVYGLILNTACCLYSFA